MSLKSAAGIPVDGIVTRGHSITETAAVSWARDGIRVNGITPGGAATETIAAWEEATPGITKHINASIRLGRMAEPAEVPQVAGFLPWNRGILRHRHREPTLPS